MLNSMKSILNALSALQNEKLELIRGGGLIQWPPHNEQRNDDVGWVSSRTLDGVKDMNAECVRVDNDSMVQQVLVN